MNEEMTPDYMTGTPNTVCADARRQFSRIGLMFLVGTALIYGVQFGASAIANAINPDLLSSTSYALLIVMIPMYVIAMPICISSKIFFNTSYSFFLNKPHHINRRM